MGQSTAELMRIARRLNHGVGRPALPPLLFVTDPARTPDPAAAAAQLPRGAGVIYRHFGAPDRLSIARRLARICQRRGLTLLIAADPALARLARAQGVHWPEKWLARGSARQRRCCWIVTAAAHSRAALVRAKAAGADAALLSPIFQSRSRSAGPPLGRLRGGRLAALASLPVYALGGINVTNARSLQGLRFAGIAAVAAFN